MNSKRVLSIIYADVIFLNCFVKKGDEYMRIEDFWTDVILYRAEFQTENGRKITKFLTFPATFNQENQISEVIKTKFRDVDKVLFIEEWGDGLYLK